MEGRVKLLRGGRAFNCNLIDDIRAYLLMIEHPYSVEMSNDAIVEIVLMCGGLTPPLNRANPMPMYDGLYVAIRIYSRATGLNDPHT